MTQNNTVIVVGGPAGTGKTTVGELLAQEWNCPFVEGDVLHPPENVAKMSKGIPLRDDDRWDWLKELSVVATEKSKDPVNKAKGAVVTCSMLKKVYRDLIKNSSDASFRFVFLYSDSDLLIERVTGRKGHFMKAEMVKSQFDIMEVPKDSELIENGGDSLAIEIRGKSPEQLVEEIRKKYDL